jgi:hypothetical protein
MARRELEALAELEAAEPDAPRLGPIHPSHSPTAAAVTVRTERNAGHSAGTLRQEIVAAGHSADKLSRYSSFQYGSSCVTGSLTKRGRRLIGARSRSSQSSQAGDKRVAHNIPNALAISAGENACQAVGQCITHTVTPQLTSTFVAGVMAGKRLRDESLRLGIGIAMGNPLAIVSAERLRLPQ